MIIGVSGKKQAGKDTICKIIQNIEGYLNVVRFDKNLCTKEEVIHAVMNQQYKSIWEKHAFADALKRCVSSLLCIPTFRFESNSFKNTDSGLYDIKGNPLTYRKILQLFGTEVGRAISPNIWVDILMNKYASLFYGNLYEPYWVVTDVRFKNEAEAIVRNGGLLIRVNRDTGLEDNHPSETELDAYDKFDEIIDNNDSMESLVGKVYDIMAKHSLL